MGFDCESPRFADSRESLLAAFMDVCDVMIKAQLIVQDDAKVIKALQHLHCLAVDGNGAMRGGEFIADVKDDLHHLCDVEEEVTVCAPLGEVGNGVFVGCD